ncbi:Uncharacterised protein [Actinobacillus pleuropneumoniae]|nr:Uncharacterised protein [Actinobacillus pleuropneumoniae]
MNLISYIGAMLAAVGDKLLVKRHSRQKGW